MSYAIIEFGKVANIVEASEGFAQRNGWISAEANGTQAQIGGTWDGESFSPAPPIPEPVPQSVTMRQARRYLLNIGRLQDVDAAIDNLPEPQRTAAKIDWEYSQVVERQSEFVLMLAPVLGWDAAGLDTMFIEADKLSA